MSAPLMSAVTPASAAKRRSELAKENNIGALDELEVQEVWAMFRVKMEGFDELEGAIRTSDVRRCLVALNVLPKGAQLGVLIDTVDPEGAGYVSYERFFAIAALQMKARHSDAMNEEVLRAYQLFTNGEDREINIADLKRIAIELKEDISDSVLLDMMREASGGMGSVGLEEFKNLTKDR